MPDDGRRAMFRPVGPRRHGSCWLLLPGWQQSAAHWTPVARWTAGAGVTLLAADLAAAAAACTAGRGTLERTAEMVDLLLADDLTAEATIAVGHSAGAPLAVLAAAALPGIRGVVMVEPVSSHLAVSSPRSLRGPWPTGSLDSQPRLRDQYPMAAEATLRSIGAALERPRERPPSTEPLSPSVPAPERAARFREALTVARVPVLVLRGQASALLSPEEAEAIAALPRAGRCATLPTAGHSPHIDRPRATAAHLIDFAAEVAEHDPTTGAVRD